MNVFYNLKGVGDVLMIQLLKKSDVDVRHDNIGNITRIVTDQNDVVGYNIFEASKEFEITETGQVSLTEELLNDINELFKKEGLKDSLEFDFSPKFVVGYVLEKSAHENADKLSVCQVDIGEETLQIVCGAANVDKGQRIVVAKVGATMPSGLEIKPTELRGVPSNGMICSRKELGLPMKEEEKGIYVLDQSYDIGAPFTF